MSGSRSFAPTAWLFVGTVRLDPSSQSEFINSRNLMLSGKVLSIFTLSSNKSPTNNERAMSNTKRKFADFARDSARHDAAGADNYGPGATLPKRQNRQHGRRRIARPDNLNWIKKRARTIERRFRTGQNLPADKENELQRELAHYKQQILDAEDEKRRDKMIKKYHMVRFFGKQPSRRYYGSDVR
jgi:uncharacterized protein with WD repeat